MSDIRHKRRGYAASPHRSSGFHARNAESYARSSRPRRNVHIAESRKIRHRNVVASAAIAVKLSILGPIKRSALGTFSPREEAVAREAAQRAALLAEAEQAVRDAERAGDLQWSQQAHIQLSYMQFGSSAPHRDAAMNARRAPIGAFAEFIHPQRRSADGRRREDLQGLREFGRKKCSALIEHSPRCLCQGARARMAPTRILTAEDAVVSTSQLFGKVQSPCTEPHALLKP